MFRKLTILNKFNPTPKLNYRFSCRALLTTSSTWHHRRSTNGCFSVALGISAAAVASAEIFSFNESQTPSEMQLGRNFIADAVDKTAPALVNIRVSSGTRSIARSSGSGFIIEESGLIVTNAHVVIYSGPNDELVVTLSDGTQHTGKLHSLDILSDLALVTINAPDGTKFPTMKIGSSSKLRAGEWVVALGSPLSLQNSVSAGIVSAVARHSSELGLAQQRTEYIQTDAAINAGNSGGPLLNLDGEVIGINSMKAAEGAGISFAIPIDTAIQVLEQLRKNKRVIRPYVGMTVANFSGPEAYQLAAITRRYPDLKYGVIVRGVTKGSPAEKGGLCKEDVIIEFGGEPVKSTNDIFRHLGFQVGKDISVTVRRNGSNIPVHLSIVTTEIPPRKLAQFNQNPLF